ncbi:hypothetical protein MHAS_01200 [Mycolicibacterium hassiacum DSM 44199]|nr:hypothetical protein MHAS_01200 [Mycolicibacterium hassiacum DSM 44199]
MASVSFIYGVAWTRDELPDPKADPDCYHIVTTGGTA